MAPPRKASGTLQGRALTLVQIRAIAPRRRDTAIQWPKSGVKGGVQTFASVHDKATAFLEAYAKWEKKREGPTPKRFCLTREGWKALQVAGMSEFVYADAGFVEVGSGEHLASKACVPCHLCALTRAGP